MPLAVRLAIGLFVAVALTLGMAAEPLGTEQPAFQLPVGCTLPFDEIKKARGIDQDCDHPGDATESEHQAQNRAKNNCVLSANLRSGRAAVA